MANTCLIVGVKKVRAETRVEAGQPVRGSGLRSSRVQANVSEKRRVGFLPPETYRCRPSGDGSERCERPLCPDASARLVVHARQNMLIAQPLTPVRAEARPHSNAPVTRRCRFGGSAQSAGRWWMDGQMFAIRHWKWLLVFANGKSSPTTSAPVWTVDTTSGSGIA